MNLISTLGPLERKDIGVILPHEHIFVDLRRGNEAGYAQADPERVIALMAPELVKAREAGVHTIIECTPVGVGRRADLVCAVSKAANFPLVLPTGIYREPWIPEKFLDMEEDELSEWMTSELEDEIEDTGVKAGWIKLSAGDDGMTDQEEKILRAACHAARRKNIVIGSHTVRGRVAREQLSVVQDCGYLPERFIWIHAQIEPDFDLNLEMAWSGAWIEYDSVGDPIYSEIIFDRVLKMLDAGLGDQVLLSHDRGWFDPAKPGGGQPLPFTYLTQTFLPRLKQAGLDDRTLQQLTIDNPFRAFARLE
jgi:phosphotriesterase-related protein